MTLQNAIYAALIMCAVTIIPRVIPITFFTHRVKSRFIRSFLHYMPSAIISAMVFPAIFFTTGNVIIASVGTVVALALSFVKKLPFFVVAIASVVVVFALGFAF